MTKRGSKTYAIYTIMVCRTTSEGTADWVVHRRYSDFHDLHMHLKDKVAWVCCFDKRNFEIWPRQACYFLCLGKFEWIENDPLCFSWHGSAGWSDRKLVLSLQFGPLPSLVLPGKKTFGNLDKLFVQKRKVSLDNYLQVGNGLEVDSPAGYGNCDINI